MTIFTNDFRVWKEVKTPSINESGVWLTPKKVFVNDDGVWKLVWFLT